MAKKTPPKFDKKRNGRTAVRPTRKNDKKSMILKGFSKKKLIWRKNRKKCDFKGLFGQKMQNSMSRFCTLLALHFYWHFGCFKNEFLLGKYRTHGPLYSNDSRVLDLRFFFDSGIEYPKNVRRGEGCFKTAPDIVCEVIIWVSELNHRKAWKTN